MKEIAAAIIVLRINLEKAQISKQWHHLLKWWITLAHKKLALHPQLVSFLTEIVLVRLPACPCISELHIWSALWPIQEKADRKQIFPTHELPCTLLGCHYYSSNHYLALRFVRVRPSLWTNKDFSRKHDVIWNSTGGSIFHRPFGGAKTQPSSLIIASHIIHPHTTTPVHQITSSYLADTAAWSRLKLPLITNKMNMFTYLPL